MHFHFFLFSVLFWLYLNSIWSYHHISLSCDGLCLVVFSSWCSGDTEGRFQTLGSLWWHTGDTGTGGHTAGWYRPSGSYTLRSPLHSHSLQSEQMRSVTWPVRSSGTRLGTALKLGWLVVWCPEGCSLLCEANMYCSYSMSLKQHGLDVSINV